MLHLNPAEPPLELRSAQWLLPYLLAMGIIVRVSAFGPMKDPWLSEWTSMVVVAAVSLVVYYWAKAVALPVGADPGARVRRGRGRPAGALRAAAALSAAAARDQADFHDDQASDPAPGPRGPARAATS